MKLWDAKTRGTRATLPVRSSVNALAFSPDGRALATVGSQDSAVRLWDVSSGHIQTTLIGHTNGVTAVAFSRDGRTLATGSDDRTVRLWDVATRRVRATLNQGDPATTVALSPDGRRLATGGFHGTLQIWDLELPDVPQAITRICQAVHRDLTKQEHTAYLPDRSNSSGCPG